MQSIHKHKHTTFVFSMRYRRANPRIKKKSQQQHGQLVQVHVLLVPQQEGRITVFLMLCLSSVMSQAPFSQGSQQIMLDVVITIESSFHPVIRPVFIFSLFIVTLNIFEFV